MVNISPDSHSNIPCEVQAGSVGKKNTVVASSTVHMWHAVLVALSSLCISITKLSKVGLALLLMDVCTLVPRPSHCKNGVRVSPFYYVNNISVYLGRQRGGGVVPDRKNVFCS